MGRAWQYFRRGPARNWLTRARHDDALAAAVPQLRGRLVDIGCSDKPYADLIAPHVTEHVGVDHADTPHDHAQPDLVATAYDIPAPDASFDSALCTCVLEHLEEPQRAINECHRLLKPGGVALYTVPFIWHEHEAPRDFYRYTRFGLTHLFTQAGFDPPDVRPLAGFWITFGQLLSYKLFKFKKGSRLLRAVPLVEAAAHTIQFVALYLDRWDPAPEWSWLHLVVARKAEPPAPTPS